MLVHGPEGAKMEKLALADVRARLVAGLRDVEWLASALDAAGDALVALDGAEPLCDALGYRIRIGV